MQSLPRYLLCFYVVLGVAVAAVPNSIHRLIFWAAIGAMILIIHNLMWRNLLTRLRDYATARQDRAASGEPSPEPGRPSGGSHQVEQ